MIIPNIWENKKWQPNHQPEYGFNNLKVLSPSSKSRQSQSTVASPQLVEDGNARETIHVGCVRQTCVFVFLFEEQ